MATKKSVKSSNIFPTSKDDRNRGAEARKRLGITPEDMVGVPQITHLLKNASGGIPACIEALRGDDSEDALIFIAKWDAITESDRARLTIEEICVAAEIGTRALVGAVTVALMQQSQDATKIMVLTSQPRVVQATIDAATREEPIMNREGEIVGYRSGDVKAQDIFHRATGFLPTPKGATINLNQLNQTAQLPEPEEGCDPPPSADDFLLEIQSAIRPDKQLEAPRKPVHAELPMLEGADV